MKLLEALGKASALVHRAHEDGRFPAGICRVTRRERKGKKREVKFFLVHEDRLDRAIHQGDELVGIIDQDTTDNRVAEMIIEDLS